MARVRISDELRDQVREYVKDSGEYDTQSELVKDAIRRLLDQKKMLKNKQVDYSVDDVDPETEEAIRNIVQEELEDKP